MSDPRLILSEEEIAVAELNGWDLQETAANKIRGTRMRELMRKYSKSQLLAMAFDGGLADFNQPAKWTKQELASTVADQQISQEQRAPMTDQVLKEGSQAWYMTQRVTLIRWYPPVTAWAKEHNRDGEWDVRDEADRIMQVPAIDLYPAVPGDTDG